MGYSWNTCPSDVNQFVYQLKDGIKEIIANNFVGFYVHGSLAMGGFHPKSSDIDVLVITNTFLGNDHKVKLAKFLLKHSNQPFPIEISFLNTEQLRHFRHPCPFDFHFSEFWRELFEQDLANGIIPFSNKVQTDADLAAHITITYQRGICIEGKAIDEVFPLVPSKDYLSSIVGDYQECLENIDEDPVYCSLNLLRVLWYVNDGVISSKQEAGKWALHILPAELIPTIQKVVDSYATGNDEHIFEKAELLQLRNYVSEHVERLLQ